MRKTVLSIVCLLICLGANAEPIRSALGANRNIYASENDTPYEAEVEWLESTGTQYILLNSLVNGIDIYLLPEDKYSQSGTIVRWNNGSRGDTIGYTSWNDRGWNINTMSFGGITTYYITYRLILVSFHDNVFEVNGTSYTTEQRWGTNYTQDKWFALFGSYNTNTKVVDCSICKIGRCDLYVGGVLTYSFIPVRIGVGDDAVGCMYDQLSETYYFNQGDGVFIIGPEKERQ